MTGPAICAHFADDCESGQAVLSLTIEVARSYIALVKWRNQLLALLCLAVFAGLGVLYFQYWVVQKPFGIILIIGEGLAPERIALTRVYLGGSDTHLALDAMPHVALVTNHSRDFAVSDQAAAASALATGVKVNNRSLSVDPDGKPLANIIDLARARGRATGLVTNGSLTNATCSAFYAHAGNSSDIDQIASQLIQGSRIDICLGMSASEFLPEAKQGQRQDNRDLLLELRQSGFDIVRSRAELESIPVWTRPKLFGTFVDRNSDSQQNQAWSDEPALSDMVRRAIELLQYNPRGYVLVVDAARMATWATGPKGVRSYGAAKIPEKETPGDSNVGASKEQTEPAAFYAKSALNTVEDVVSFGTGPGTEALHGTIDNTKIFEILREGL